MNCTAGYWIMMNNVFWAIWFSFSTWILAEAIVCKCVRKRVAKILLLVHTQKIQLICELLLSGYCWNVKILDVIIKKPFVEKATEQLIERWRWSSLTRLWPRSASHSLFFFFDWFFFSFWWIASIISGVWCSILFLKWQYFLPYHPIHLNTFDSFAYSNWFLTFS